MKNNKISIAKGLGIMLVVVGHSGPPQLMWDFIYMFHMPLFFCLSGYFFKQDYVNQKKEFILKRLKALYIPFVQWSLIFLIFHNIFYKINVYNGLYGYQGKVSFLYDFNDFLKNIYCIVLKMSVNEPLLGGYWFLRELFLASILILFLQYLCNKARCGRITLFVILIITVHLFSYFNWRIPLLGINKTTCLAMCFYYIGFIYHQFEKDEWYTVKGLLFSFAVILGAAIIHPTYCSKVSVMDALYFIVISFMGVYFTLNISCLLEKTKLSNWLIYVGYGTIYILTFHFLSFKLVSLFKIVQFNLPIEQLAMFPVIQAHNNFYWILYSIVGIIVSLILKEQFGRLRATPFRPQQ